MASRTWIEVPALRISSVFLAGEVRQCRMHAAVLPPPNTGLERDFAPGGVPIAERITALGAQIRCTGAIWGPAQPCGTNFSTSHSDNPSLNVTINRAVSIKNKNGSAIRYSATTGLPNANDEMNRFSPTGGVM